MDTDKDLQMVATVPSGVDGAVGVPERKWFVAIVNARHERVVADKLIALNIESYVATQRELRVWKNGRKKYIDRVIIPSLVFVRCTELQRIEIVKLPFIFRFLVNRTSETGKLSKPVAVIRNQEIEKLKFMLGQSDYPVDFEPVHYKVNDTVRVIRGSLVGLVGEVVKASDGTTTLTVVIDQLGCAKVSIEPTDIELI